MPSVASHEHDHDRAREIAERGCILRSLVGSTVHGLANAGTDDRDEMGVCVEPVEYVAGLRRFEHYVFRTQPDGVPSGPADLDLVVYGLRKYVRLALKGSPTVLLLLFAPDDAIMVRTELGAELQALAPRFVARRTGRAFLGYLEGQRGSLTAEAQPSRTRELSAVHGYDTKYAMHALRIAHQGRELLETGRISLPVPEPERSRLMAIRRGTVPLDEVLAELDDAVRTLEALAASDDLPPEPDAAALDAFLVDAYARAWGFSTRSASSALSSRTGPGA